MEVAIFVVIIIIALAEITRLKYQTNNDSELAKIVAELIPLAQELSVSIHEISREFRGNNLGSMRDLMERIEAAGLLVKLNLAANQDAAKTAGLEASLSREVLTTIERERKLASDTAAAGTGATGGG